MRPEELAKVEPTEAEARSPPRRSSPRRPPPGRNTEAQPGETAQPARAAHERKRKLPQKPSEARVRGRQKLEHRTAPSKVSPQDRIAQFPDNSLAVDPTTNNYIRCMACKKSVFNKWSSLSSHCKKGTEEKPTMHEKNLAQWLLRTDDDKVLKESLLAYYEANPNESAKANNPDEMVFRYRTTETFLAAGVALSTCDIMRPLLQRTGIALTDSAHLGVYIPKIESTELELQVAEMRDEYLGFAFDGTTRLGEAINTCAKWCPKEFVLQKRLVDFTTMQKHLSGMELANHEQDLIMRKCSIRPAFVVCFARDSVAANGVACRALVERPFTNACNMMCFSHTFGNGGKRINLPTLAKFKTPWLELAGGRDPVPGAKALWKQTVAPAEVQGYSHVRWWAWAEITFVIAEAGMRRLGDFISTCEQREYGDATTKVLRAIYTNEVDALRLELAAMLDVRIIVKTTYEMEGDRLEILLIFERVEALRALGRAIKAEDDGCLPNVDATLRKVMKLQKDVVVEKYYQGHGVCKAKLVKTEKVMSTLYPGKQVDAWKVKYVSDGNEEYFEEEELRSGSDGPAPSAGDGKPVLVVRDLAERSRMCQALTPCFDYLEARITGNTVGESDCQQQYSCVEMYEICRVVRAFNPNFADTHVDAAFIDSMAAIKPLNGLNMLPGMKRELPLYLAAAKHAPIFDKSDVEAFTNSLLTWWRTNGKAFPAWALAARVAFAISPNSAMCERVFALIKTMFGEQQMSALADLLQAALMLRFNGRRVG